MRPTAKRKLGFTPHSSPASQTTYIKGGTSAVARARVRALGGREGHDRGRDEGLDHSRRQLKGWIELIVKKRSWVSLKTVPVKKCLLALF